MKGTEDVKGKDILTVKESWVQKLNLDEVQPPIITSTPRGEPTEKMTINMLSRMKRMADIMRDSTKRFRTSSDVIRAAMYIGMTVLFHMFENQMPYRGKTAFERLQMLAVDLEEVEIAEEAVRNAKLIIDKAEQKWFSREDAAEKIMTYRNGIKEKKLKHQFDVEFKDMLLKRKNPADLMFYLGKFKISLTDETEEAAANASFLAQVAKGMKDHQ